MKAALLTALTVGPIGCESVARSAAEHAAEPEAIAAATGEPIVTERPRLRSSRRCGECHVEIAESWRGSAHAGSASDPLFTAMRADANDSGCDQCHAPLADLLEPGSAVAAEGVTCDACHTAERVELTDGAGRLVLSPSDNVKRGPLCDARDHYFHRVACVPMFERSEMCAGCHSPSHHTPTGSIAIHGEYDEWRASPFGPSGSGAACQSCHMPSTDGAVAEGWADHERFSAHGPIAGVAPARSPLHVVLAMRAKGEHIAIDATISNRDAGHSLPTGLPGRRLRLDVRTLDADGGELDRWTHEYGTWLVDEAGREAPFYAAARLERDDRIVAGGKREHELVLHAPGAVRLELRLTRHSVSEPLAARLGIARPEQRELAIGSIDIPAPGPARRRKLATPLEVIP